MNLLIYLWKSYSSGEMISNSQTVKFVHSSRSGEAFLFSWIVQQIFLVFHIRNSIDR